MEYLIGVLLAVFVAGLALAVGFARDRGFYTTVLIVVATYYVLFAVMGGSGRALSLEIAAAAVFLACAIVGYRVNFGLVAAALVGHGVFDVFHHRLIHNPGVPPWWPGFCMAFDVVFGLWLALRLRTPAKRPLDSIPPIP